jgi:hypothetical protein
MSERVPMGYTWWIVVEDKDRHIRHFVRDDRAERTRLLLDIPVTPEEDEAWEAMEREREDREARLARLGFEPVTDEQREMALLNWELYGRP